MSRLRFSARDFLESLPIQAEANAPIHKVTMVKFFMELSFLFVSIPMTSRTIPNVDQKADDAFSTVYLCGSYVVAYLAESDSKINSMKFDA